MRQKLIQTVVTDMLSYLNNAQVEKLQEVLLHTLWDYDISPSDGKTKEQEQDLLALFLAAKRIEGCSEKSLNYYQATTQAMLDGIGKPIKEIVTEDIRQYLTNYQRERHSSRVTIDNIRRILSSFFSWLEDEDYILKSPVRRIHKVKTASNIKETYSDETLELMRDSCSEMRDLAMIDLLASTGMRVGEMVLLNRDDVDFAERECVVFGKGDKERILKELDLYNINEATLFPELEHQLSYIKYINSGNVQAVADFEKYDTHAKADSTPQNLDDESLNTYILSNLSNLLSGIAKPKEIEDLKGIIQSNFAVDWYNRDAIISKLRMSISGYYFVKLKDKKEAKEKAVQITTCLRQAVNDYTATNIKGGE